MLETGFGGRVLETGESVCSGRLGGFQSLSHILTVSRSQPCEGPHMCGLGWPYFRLCGEVQTH